MKRFRFDVIVIGCGPAGATAAGTLARAGLSVLVLEAGAYAGAENWSGCVYFAENLAEADAFGEAAVLAAPYERRLVRRGIFLHNGLDLVGFSYQNQVTFPHCYTVLRPVYDPYWADQARAQGAMLLPQTTVTSLIRRDGRVVGVETEHGPVYAEATFIAEGDASHLVRRERLERTAAPHFMQGVKAVFRLPPAAIEERFHLSAGEGCAYEYLIRNAQIGGQTVHLNIGAFLYTNRDSLSFGYVVPLENLREAYRGDHGRLMEWLRGLPHFKALLKGAALSAYGTKLIRSGGIKEQPILVEDGLAVGGAATGLGIDLPYPNFTGPASASGLLFARAVRALLKDGRPITADRLRQSYLEPLHASVYGQNAAYLSSWPEYLETSKAFFGRSADLACGLIHFLTQPRAPLRHAARFLRGHLSARVLREIFSDAVQMIRVSGLGAALSSGLNFSLFRQWTANLSKTESTSDPGFLFRIEIFDQPEVDVQKFPWPIRGWFTQLSPGLAEGMKIVYANDGRPLSEKFRRAVRSVLARLRLTDWIALPCFASCLALLAASSIIYDFIRYYLLRQPVEKILSGPVADYIQAQQTLRDLDQVKTADSLEAKLATNTYRIGTRSHIRVFWPDELIRHGDLAQSPLWSVCPARVYQYDPPLVGRGVVTVNYENCIKCESCWHAADDQVRWGRHTDHRLIYRPESEAIQILLNQKATSVVPHPPHEETRTLTRLKPGIPPQKPHREILENLSNSLASVLRAVCALETAVEHLPSSADASRREWPRKIGAMTIRRIDALQTLLASENIRKEFSTLGISDPVQADWRLVLKEDAKDLKHQLSAGQEFHALSAARRIRDETVRPMIEAVDAVLGPSGPAFENRNGTPFDSGLHERLAALFPDRIVKEWEDFPIPEEARERLRSLIINHAAHADPLIRAFSAISPALGLLAARGTEALKILKQARQPLHADRCAVDGHSLSIRVDPEGLIVDGVLELVPLALSDALVMVYQNRAWEIPLDQPGLKTIPTPAIGFRSAGLHRLEFKAVEVRGPGWPVGHGPQFGIAYAAVALGAADYLARRAKEHADGRVQFARQMRDTQGRDGIAKLGAVKAMIARIEAWHLLLAVLLEENTASESSERPAEWSDLCATAASLAFGPEAGQMGYDAGQIFGGFAYSEDDLLSRAYRDSALFRYLAPGFGAAERLVRRLPENALTLEAMDASSSLQWGEVRNGPLSEAAKHWDENISRWKRLFPESDPAKAGDAAALLLGARRVLLKVQERLEQGLTVEGDASASAVLVGLAEQAVDAMEFWRRDSTVLPITVFPERPEVERVDLPMQYEAICNPSPVASSQPYQSGQYLLSAFDTSVRFVPEIQLHDPSLRERWRNCTDWFVENIWMKRFDGMHIERYVEKIHGIPEGTLEGFKKNGYFSTVIPSELGGGGWSKAEYYILTTAAGRFGDAGLLLVIMASTSIGTTPMLLGLEKELPLAARELEPLTGHPHRLGEIGDRLDRLITGMRRPDPARLKKGFTELMALVDSRIRHTRVVKYLAANFLKAFYAAGIAGQRRDLEGFRQGLIAAKALFDQLAPTVRQAVDELPRRERAHQFFLRKLGHGGISAFALTEPTAGSDTGGVKTTARPISRPLTPLEDGRYRFNLTEGETNDVPSPQAPRYLIDADRVRFDDGSGPSGMVYNLPTNESVPIRCDEYNYDTDEGLRYYLFQDQKRYFHDIAQIRVREGKPVYDYYELSGAKMWITNGRVATQYCLYAQSPEGVTGFMVDRHAEGLKVGADERKMGQRGSPTNEIAIDQVRVPKECVIGYEGHGQVNALETLNVGRCGLAVASITLMRKLLLDAREQVPATPQRDRLLGEAAAILFGSDSMAFHLVGLFDRHTTESVRMESAIAKYVCSEDLHEVITLIEQAYGPAAVTEKYRVEKLRRDSRILNIYEGTNEVQRFLILKDLIAMSKDWRPVATPEGTGDGSEALPSDPRLAFWKETLRVHVKAAADRLGDTVWMDAVLQATYFLLADMAGEIFRLDCLVYRIRWLKENREKLGAAYIDPLLTLAERAVWRAEHRLSLYDQGHHRDAERAMKGLYAPEAVAADAALERMGRKAAAPSRPTGRLARPLRILCLLRLVADTAPAPRLKEGRLSEIVWRFNPADESALNLAIRLKEANPSSVTVHLVLPGGPDAESHLRWALGYGADAAYRIEALATADGSAFVEAISELEKSRTYDLILTGSASEDGAEPLGPFVAGATSRYFTRLSSLEIAAGGRELAIRTDDGSEIKVLPNEPMVLSWDRADAPPRAKIRRVIEGQLARIERLSVHGKNISERLVPARSVVHKSETIRELAGVADYLNAYRAGARAMEAEPYPSRIDEMPLPTGPAVWTIIEARQTKMIPALLGAGNFLGRSLDQKSCAVVLGPEKTWPQLIGLARSRGLSGAVCISAPEGLLTESGRLAWLKKFSRVASELRIVCGPHWADALSHLSGSLNGKTSLLFTDLIEIDRRDGLSLFKTAYGGKLRRSVTPLLSQTPNLFLTVSPTGDFPSGEPSARFTAGKVATPSLKVDPDWFESAPPVAPDDLASAEVIIDVGYGLRNQEGLHLAVRLKEVLEQLGLTVHLGATRKVTQDLKLLPLSHQIGQTGVRVNPKLILALGISGAPQHMDYIGDRAVIFAFNKDPHAPLMKLNETRPSPIVHPIVGDLFESIPKLIEMLSQ
ncbi:MAG TPA: acyl-CoA dehydrogenase family protein [Nitrospiria bacterium]|nr:acyl-CoA dehydrogenase family protein [Nitrospiria bacterium]